MANPPITIGEIADTPAPGSGVKSAWCQEITNRIVQRFGTKVLLDGWAAADGAVAYTADFGQLWRRHGGVWKDPYPRGRVATGPVFDAATTGTTQLNTGTISNVRLFAGRLYTARLTMQGGGYGTVANDVFNLGYRIDAGGFQGVHSQTIYIANAYLFAGVILAPFTTADGLHTVDACAQRSLGTGTLQFRGRLDIIDEGPA